MVTSSLKGSLLTTTSVIIRNNAAYKYALFPGRLCSKDSCDVARTITQTLWPVHCVMDTEGAELSPELTKESGVSISRRDKTVRYSITKTFQCNIQRFFSALKIENVISKEFDIFNIFFTKTLIVGTL